MPPQTANPEAVARAVLEKPPTPGATRSAAQERGDRIREKVKAEGSRSALESLRRPEPIDKVKTNGVADNNIGIERDATSGAKVRASGSPEEARFNSANNWKQFSEKIIESGYNSLTAPNQLLARQQVENVINAWPEGAAFLAGLSAAERQATLEAILKDRSFTLKLQTVYNEVFDADKALPDLVTAARSKVTELEAEQTKNDTDVAANTGKIGVVNAQLDRHKIDPATGTPVGADIVRIKNIEGRLPALAVDLSVKSGELSILKEEKRLLEMGVRAGTVNPVDVSTKIAEISAKTAEIEAIQGEIKEKADLEQKKVNLDENKRTLDQEKADLEARKDVLVRDLSAARADLASKILGRGAQEDQFVDSVKGMVSETTMRQMEEQIAASEAAGRELLQKEIDSTEDPGEKAILKQLMDRWEKDKDVGTFSKSKIKVYDKVQINSDFSNLMASGDPKELLRDMMTKGGLTAAEASAKLADPEFVAKMQPKAIERLIAYKLQTGKLSEDEARRIFNSPWGEGMIDAALKRREDLQKVIADLEGKGILQGGIKEWYRKASGGSLIKFLLLLLASGVASYVAVNALPIILGAGATGTAARTGLKNVLFPAYK